MNKRILIIITAILVCIVTLVFFVARKNSLQQTPAQPASSTYALPNAPQPPPSSLPLAQTIDQARHNARIGAMKDASGNIIIGDRNNTMDYILTDENNYSIDYYGKYDSFLIQIKKLPFDQNRKEAELRFLQIVNAPADIACQLNVRINTTYAVDPNLAGNNFHLSFCK